MSQHEPHEPGEGGQDRQGQPGRIPLPRDAGALLSRLRRDGWGSNLRTRLLAGVPALLLLLALLAVAPVVLLALVVTAAGVWGYYEYLGMLQRGGGVALPRGALLAGAALVGLGAATGQPQAMHAMLFVALLLAVWAVMFHTHARSPEGLEITGSALAGLMLIPWFVNHLTLLLWLPEGRGLVAFLILALVANDTLAYLVGSLLGRTPLVPAISPRKTLEGAFGGLLGGLLAGLAAHAWLGGPQGFSLAWLLVLGLLLAAAGQAGDLIESKLKRLTGMDESGTFLPGHGGLLDRMDAFLLATPLFYYLLLAAHY